MADFRDPSCLAMPKISANFDPPSCETSTPTTVSPNARGKSTISQRVTADAADKDVTAAIQTDKASYAKVLGPSPVRKQDVPAHMFCALKPEKHGEEIALTIPSALYKKQVEEFKHALIGRVLLRKGEKPKPNLELKQDLQKLWNIQESWRLIAMGKGFFILNFSIPEDKARVKQHLLWELPSGSVRIREWTKIFDPYREISSLSQVWVRIYNLPVECRHLEVIAGIGRHIGVPLKLDKASIQGEFGHFARILIEVNLSLQLPDSLLINCDEGSFYIEFSYENLLHYCSRCQITGHTISRCRKGEAKKPASAPVSKPQEKEKGKEENRWREKEQPETSTHSAKGVNGSLTQPFEDLYGPDLLEKVLVPIDDELRNEEEQLDTENSDSESDGYTSSAADTVFDEQEFENQALETLQDIAVPAPSAKHDQVVEHSDAVATDMIQPAPRPPTSTDTMIESSHMRESEIVHNGADKIFNLQVLETTMKVNRIAATVDKKCPELDPPPKKRGRPPGQKKKVSTRPEDSIKGRLRKPEQLDNSRPSSAELLINRNLTEAIASGQKPRDFAISKEKNTSMQTMNNVSAKSWASEVEREDARSTHRQ